MAQNWVQHRMQGQITRQQREQDDRIKSQYALAGAPKIFERLCDQLQKDIAAFYVHGGDTALSCQSVSTQKLRIRKATYPSVTLDIELDLIMVNFERIYKFDDTSHYETTRGSLRISSDLVGNVQIYKNGSPFLDESEVSEFFLEPIFTYIG